jgi:hypothetical protein
MGTTSDPGVTVSGVAYWHGSEMLERALFRRACGGRAEVLQTGQKRRE